MKFVKSNFAQKIIILLVALIIFNVAYPTMSYAADLGGILLWPIYALTSYVFIATDLVFGATIWLKEFSMDEISSNVESLLSGDYGEHLSDWFVGPDTIFLRKNNITKC